MQTLLVGIDAACKRVLDPLFEAGATPTLESLFESGVSGTLESQIPPWTPSAWPGVYTGVNPGQHGAFSFLTFEGYDWDVINRTDVDELAIWELLDRQGFSSVVVNVPVTGPADEIDGAIVPGYTAPEDPRCHPQGLLDDIREEIGEYRIYGEIPARKTPSEAKIEEYCSLTRSRGEAFRYLADRFDPDFGFLQFQQTDTVFHEYPDHWNVVERIYETVDEQVRATIDEHDPDTVIVVSDHGIGEYEGYEFRVNEFLADEGFVERTAGESGMPSWSSIAESELLEGKSGKSDERSILERSLSAAASVGLTSQRIAAALDRVGLKETVAKRVPGDIARAAAEQVDFESSTAYMRSRIELGVRINLVGREPSGIVEPGEYETVRTRLIDALEGAKTPNGDPVFESVVRRESLYHGKHVENAPDIVTIPAEFDHFLTASLRGDQFGPPQEPWNHKIDGSFAVSGTAIEAPGTATAHLFDIAPTVLATLDVPASDRMDGSAMPCVEPAGRKAYPEYHRDGKTRTDDAKVEQQLADLGYIE
ncbi:alkaline phosphatase family protein [Natranaeroarchaeum aerophilus]|uniref:Alkaline phosphatase family protein n=1 Tax=Natranaeroarchaeum aerophilus TaxID=2917711 RepID=A0AAE3FRZ7_9EURY|nr:alkaline phosphatase family protein [Natranaeroarchaeum aerophilus]MCL9814020.1 alkaline phosphatase family protein [Natranaeroarchaeum aerophilus]